MFANTLNTLKTLINIVSVIDWSGLRQEQVEIILITLKIAEKRQRRRKILCMQPLLRHLTIFISL